MSERDEKLEKFVDNWLASTVTPKVEKYLEDNREEIVRRYGADKPHIDVVREKLHREQPVEVIDPIDVALELREAIEAVKRRNFVLPLAMFHIGGLFDRFEMILGKRDVPLSLKESFRSMVAAEDGLKPHKPRLKKIDEVLEAPISTIEDSYAEEDDLTQVELVDWLLNVYPTLPNEIVAAMKPRTIRNKKPDEWTADDKRYYGRTRLMKEATRIAREHGRPVFGDHGVKKIK